MDYTDLQVKPIAPVDQMPEPTSAEQISRSAQRAYLMQYGPRSKEVHVSGSRSASVWYMSRNWGRYLYNWPDDRCVFIPITGEDAGTFVGWLYARDVTARWLDASNGGYDVRGPFQPMETFVP